MSRLSYAFIEVAVLGLFVGAARFAWHTGGRRRLVELLSAVPYGLLLEQGDITIFGSYAYSQSFFVKLGAVPVAIALAWAMIITSCMYLSDSFGVPTRLAPASDAVLAIALDLSFDAIAIRQGLWHWSIPLESGYFGVPAGNFYAWLFVAFGFSAWTRLIRRVRWRTWEGIWAQLLVPLPAYATLLAALVPYVLLTLLVFPAPGAGLPIFLVVLTVFVLVGGPPLLHPAPGLPRAWQMPLLPRLALHGYFLAVGVAAGIFWKIPFLLVMSLAMLSLDLWLVRRPQAVSPREQMATESIA